MERIVQNMRNPVYEVEDSFLINVRRGLVPPQQLQTIIDKLPSQFSESIVAINDTAVYYLDETINMWKNEKKTFSQFMSNTVIMQHPAGISIKLCQILALFYLLMAELKKTECSWGMDPIQQVYRICRLWKRFVYHEGPSLWHDSQALEHTFKNIDTCCRLVKLVVEEKVKTLIANNEPLRDLRDLRDLRGKALDIDTFYRLTSYYS
jgi:hypothetical protein